MFSGRAEHVLMQVKPKNDKNAQSKQCCAVKQDLCATFKRCVFLYIMTGRTFLAFLTFRRMQRSLGIKWILFIESYENMIFAKVDKCIFS